MNSHSSQLHFNAEPHAPLKQPTVTVTQEQVNFFIENGYTHVEALTTQEEIDFIRTQYDEWFSKKLGRSDGNFFDLFTTDEDNLEMTAPQMLWPSKYGFDLYSTQLYANALEISRKLLCDPEKTVFKGDHAIMKPVSSRSVATPWHQDEAYWNPSTSYHCLGVWVALQPVDTHNGCMHFVPGSHKKEKVWNHHTFGRDKRVHGLEIDEYPEEELELGKGVAVPLPTGGATFHHCRTLHSTTANKSNAPRRAYTLSFQSETFTRPLAVPRNYYWNNRETLREKRAKDSNWNERAP